MRMGLARFGLLVVAGVVLAGACGGSSGKHGVACDEPGLRDRCVCTGDVDGTRTCQEDGYWSDCDCSTPFVEADGGSQGSDVGSGGATGEQTSGFGGSQSGGNGGSSNSVGGNVDAAGSSGGPTTGGGGEAAGAGGVAGGSVAGEGGGGAAGTAGTAGAGEGGASAGTAGRPGGAGTGGAAGAPGGTAGAPGGTAGASGFGPGGVGGDGGDCVGTLCGDDCVQLDSDTNHCGACDHACAATNAFDLGCSGGVCSPSCAYLFFDCTTPGLEDDDDGCETDGTSDPGHCGGCEHVCDDNALNSEPACNAGVCEHTCDEGWADCNGDLNDATNNGCETDITSDPDHCGDCYSPCLAPKVCQGGKCDWPSCAGMNGTECNEESCCTTIVLLGGTYPMGRQTEVCVGCTDGCPSGMTRYSYEQPEHPATVSSFALDKYEVTVGRFAAFVEAYGEGWRPGVGDGANAAVEAAQELAPGTTGWQSDWDAELPANRAALEGNITCDSSLQTWGRGEDTYPVNCVNWFEAFAFCVWDGGRLPTEAEWEYAAAGGAENRLYPWGNNVTEPLPANYGGQDNSPLIAVGSHPDGNGRWGHADLAGSMWEWVFDWWADNWYTTTETGCSDCVNLTPFSHRVRRGGVWNADASTGGLRAAFRTNAFPGPPEVSNGLRCSRIVP